MDLEVHVVTLKRTPDRLASVSAALAAKGVVAWRPWWGIDARDIGLRRLETAFGARAGEGARPATPGDMACTLSHVALWREIAQAAAAGAVVLEDDAALAQGFARWTASDVLQKMHRWRIGVLKLEDRGRVVGRELGGGVWRLGSAALGSAGYVITREAAAALAGRFGRPAMPVDHLLFGALSPARRMLRPGVVVPGAMRQDTDAFPSLIAPERAVWGTRRFGWRDRVGRVTARALVATGRAEWVG